MVTGCGQASRRPPAALALPRSYIPLTIGPGPRYRPPARSRSATTTVAGLACGSQLGPRVGVHVELFAHRHVVLLPAGIGVADRQPVGAHVRGEPCYLPLVTLAPTGLVELRTAGRPLALGDLFAVWGQPLGSSRLAGFAGHRVNAFVDGRPIAGDPTRVRLRRHDEIVLEIAGYVVPHADYRFPAGL